MAALLALLGAAGAPAGSAAPPVPSVTAVVSVVSDAGSAVLSGVRVVSQFPALSTAVVSGTPAQLATLRGRPGVRSVVADYVLRPTGHKDLLGGSVYATEGLGGSAGRDDAGRGVTVAVIDTGISDTPALNRASRRLLDGLDASGDGSFTDGYGHGTFMANLVAGGDAPGSDGASLGVAPGARVVNVKVADATGATSLSQVMAGMSYVHAYRDRIDVVEFAFSGERPGPSYGPDPLTDAVERLRAGGLVVVVPSGNESGELGDPGFDPYALTVGAADTRGKKAEVADFSGYGNVHGVEKPDVVASGVGVLSLLPAASVLAVQNPASRQPSGLYRGSGTSHATAITAGVAAMFLQNHPDASPAEVKASLRSATRKVSGVGGGEGLVTDTTRLVDPTRPRGSNVGTGEESLDTEAWESGSWLDGAWVEPNAQRWRAQRWADGENWLGQRWTGQRWTGQRWTGQRWVDVYWDGQRWVDDWDGQRWTDGEWDGQRWTDGEWDGQRWTDGSWDGQRWTAQRWSAQRWSAQRWGSVQWQ
jgi:serine protease AprX